MSLCRGAGTVARAEARLHARVLQPAQAPRSAPPPRTSLTALPLFLTLPLRPPPLPRSSGVEPPVGRLPAHHGERVWAVRAVCPRQPPRRGGKQGGAPRNLRRRHLVTHRSRGVSAGLALLLRPLLLLPLLLCRAVLVCVLVSGCAGGCGGGQLAAQGRRADGGADAGLRHAYSSKVAARPVCLWDFPLRPPPSCSAHTGPVWSLAALPDGSGFVSGSADHDIKFWEWGVGPSPDTGAQQLAISHTRWVGGWVGVGGWGPWCVVLLVEAVCGRASQGVQRRRSKEGPRCTAQFLAGAAPAPRPLQPPALQLHVFAASAPSPVLLPAAPSK